MLAALPIALRLSSTLRLDGYFPTDKYGDFFFQSVDVCSLVIAIWLLHRVIVVQSRTYQASEDAPTARGSLVLAMVFLGDMDARPYFDTFWMAGLFVGIAQVLPQLWLIARQVPWMLSQAFMSRLGRQLTLERRLHVVWARLHHVSVSGQRYPPCSVGNLGSSLSLADLGDYYAKAMMKHGFAGRLELPVGASHYV